MKGDHNHHHSYFGQNSTNLQYVILFVNKANKTWHCYRNNLLIALFNCKYETCCVSLTNLILSSLCLSFFNSLKNQICVQWAWAEDKKTTIGLMSDKLWSACPAFSASALLLLSSTSFQSLSLSRSHPGEEENKEIFFVTLALHQHSHLSVYSTV